MENSFGIINIYKEQGYTSHDVVNIVRKKLNRAKVGHTGTLDPNATGVLPICIGKATKVSEYIASSIKGYTAYVKLGIKTTTQDIWGDIIEEKEVCFSKSDIEQVVFSFLGEIEQIPPMYSAIKINGKKLYQIAREGKEIERKARKVQIFDIKINQFLEQENMFEISVICSKGTYIRTLCNDIGEKLGCFGCMAKLERTKSGNFDIENSISLKQLDEYISNEQLNKILIPIEEVLKEYKRVYILKNANKFLYNGNKLSFNYIKNKEILKQNDKILVYDFEKNLIGIYTVFKDYIKPLTMLL